MLFVFHWGLLNSLMSNSTFLVPFYPAVIISGTLTLLRTYRSLNFVLLELVASIIRTILTVIFFTSFWDFVLSNSMDTSMVPSLVKESLLRVTLAEKKSCCKSLRDASCAPDTVGLLTICYKYGGLEVTTILLLTTIGWYWST